MKKTPENGPTQRLHDRRSVVGMHAIPTVYRGRQFRSRLEARWAAFFDLMKWNWDYEPIDLNGWIPDFVVGDFSTGAYVEVKPIDFGPARYMSEVRSSISGLEITHARDQVPITSRGFIVLGLRPFMVDELPDLMQLGPVWEPTWNRWGLPIVSRHDETGRFDLAVGSDPYPGLMTGHDFKSQCWSVGREVLALWHEAGNIVQWKSPVRRGSSYGMTTQQISEHEATYGPRR